MPVLCYVRVDEEEKEGEDAVKSFGKWTEGEWHSMFRMFLRHGSIINYSSLDSSCFMFYGCVHDLLED